LVFYFFVAALFLAVVLRISGERQGAGMDIPYEFDLRVGLRLPGSVTEMERTSLGI
jgi:hypothetical protein